MKLSTSKRAAFLALCPLLALGNTEIFNFVAEPVENPDIFFIHDWPILNEYYPSLRWDLAANADDTRHQINLEPCRQLFNWSPSERPPDCMKELWLILDIDSSPQWEGYSRYTLRLSWPASYPVDAYLKVFSPSEIASLPRPGPPRRMRSLLGRSLPPSHTRTKYARIQLLSTAVWTPSALESNRTAILDSVPIILTLEPLMFGVLPKSLLPTVMTLLLAATLGFFLARGIISYLQNATDPSSTFKGTKEE